MQRPESVKTRGSTAAAELERQRSSKRKKTTERGENGRPRSCLFIREGRLRRREKRGGQTSLSSGPDASVFGRVSKGKDPLEDMTE
jgi:hypothetical protein